MTDPILQETGADGIAVWRFDAPGEKVNALSLAVVARLEALIAEAAKRGDLKAVLISSAKPGQFVAGADIEELKGVLGHPDKAREASALGHRIFSSLEALKIPTVAVINGTCLGGGTELALSCRYRLMADDEGIRIGLPETRLGILPAWGGCTRLPRLIGLRSALDLILSGRQIDPRQALSRGLVDDLVPAEDPIGAARRFLEKPRRRRGGSWLLDRNPLGRALVFSRAAAQTKEKSGGHYPALEKVFSVMKAGTFAAEEEALAELASLPATRRLVDLFFMVQENRKADFGLPPPVREVQRLGVLGAGLMGSGIAGLAAAKGLPVRLKDVDAEAVAKGMARIADSHRGDRHVSPKILARIAAATDWQGFGGVDLLVEAVPEVLDLKRRVLAEFQAASPGGIFASNTSTLPITAIAGGAKDPGLVVGLHFFNPVGKMPLVELIQGNETRPEATAAALAFARRLGKTVVLVKDSPGFLVNRLLGPYLNEAAFCMEEGAPMPMVDAAMRQFGMPMGPVALLQQVGLGVVRHAGKVLEQAFPRRMKAAALLTRLPEGQPLLSNPAVETLIRELHRPAKGPWTEAGLQERLVLPLLNEAAWALGEGVVASPRDLDLAMVLGTGFAPFRGGPLRHADALGIGACVAALRRLEATHGERFTPAPLLQEMARAGRGFHPV